MYNGLEIAFFTAIYPTSVAFTEAFGGDTRKLLGFAGILIGVGSLLGGLVFGVLVDKYVKSSKKKSPLIQFFMQIFSSNFMPFLCIQNARL